MKPRLWPRCARCGYPMDPLMVESEGWTVHPGCEATAGCEATPVADAPRLF